MDNNSLTFSLTRAELPVKLDGKDYRLVELDGKSRDMYFNDSMNRMEVDEEGKPTKIRRYDGIQALLIALCLRDDKDVLVKMETINTWPSTVVEKLYKAARKLSNMEEDKKAEAAAKNVLPLVDAATGST